MSDAELSATARKVLIGLAGFEPAWVLSGRAALRRFPGVPSPITRLDLVWRGREHLGTLPQEVCQALAEVGLSATILEADARVAWLRVSDAEDDCLVKLAAEPTPPLEPPWRAALAGISFEVESPRDILAATICDLRGRPDPWELDNLLLFQNRPDLDRGLTVDAPQRNPGFSTLEFVRNLAVLQNLDDADEHRASTDELLRYILEKIDDEGRKGRIN